MYIEKVLERIGHTVEEIEFISRHTADGALQLDLCCVNGKRVFHIIFKKEEDREIYWRELSERPPIPFVMFGNSFFRAKYLSMIKIEEIRDNIPAIILCFTSPGKIIQPYMSTSLLKKDYQTIIQILSQDQDCRANVFFGTTQQ